MTISASANNSTSLFDFLAAQPTQDADLVRQLPFVPGLREILMLRQVHALEHATVWILSQLQDSYKVAMPAESRQVDNELLGGLSTEEGFYLYGEVSKDLLDRAVHLARHRLLNGEGDLAVHPRCGTNFSVAMLLTAGLAVGIHLLLPRGPIEQLLGLGVAATAAAQLTPELGTLAQRYVTTAIPLNLAIADITVRRDFWGRSAYFVQVRWVE